MSRRPYLMQARAAVDQLALMQKVAAPRAGTAAGSHRRDGADGIPS